MVTRIRRFFAAPVFDGDEDKTRTARVLNTILVAGMMFLILLGGVAVLFLFVEKLYNTLAILVFFVTLAVARWLMRRGRVRSASALFVSTSWIVFTVFISLSGGMTSIVAVFYVAGTVVAGLLLGTRATLIHTVTCSLTGLAMVALEASGYALPRLFPVPAIVGWVDLTVSLLLTAAVLNLVLRGLNDVLGLAERRLGEREEVEEALRQSNEFLHSVLHNSPSSIFVRDLEGRYLLVNRQYQRVIGLTSEQAIGKRPEELHRPGAAAQIIKGDQLVLESGMPFDSEETVLVDEDLHTFIATKVPLRDAAGQPYALCTVATDITERKEAELEKEHLQERLIQAQKMEAVGRLAGGIAHDFNNVLTAIQGYGQVLVDDLASDDPESWPAAQTIRADLGEILEAADRAASLTQQLLAFSRKQVLQPRVLDLNDLLLGVENMLRRLIGEDIDLTMVLAPDLGYVRADPGQIEQVMMNLSVNARDAMPQGGRLTFETANVALDQAYAHANPDVKPGRYALLAVSDDGAGMSDEVKAHLFEPFFTTKAQGGGTGLGLATVYGIVEQSGGQIEVYSQVGVGTTFKVYLPLVEGTAGRSGHRKATEEMPSGTETILLVEDDPSVRDLVHRVLRQCGYTVLVAGHPQEAMALSEAHTGEVHLLVTDVVMPGQGGKVLAERLVASRPQMKVLYISGYTDNAIVHHGVLDADVHFVQKPFTPSALARKVRDVLDGA